MNSITAIKQMAKIDENSDKIDSLQDELEENKNILDSNIDSINEIL